MVSEVQDFWERADPKRDISKDTASASGQFTGKQSLAIVCSVYSMDVDDPKLQDNLLDFDDGELNELAGLLRSSPPFSGVAISRKCVEYWLQGREVSFRLLRSLQFSLGEISRGWEKRCSRTAKACT